MGENRYPYVDVGIYEALERPGNRKPGNGAPHPPPRFQFCNESAN